MYTFFLNLFIIRHPINSIFPYLCLPGAHPVAEGFVNGRWQQAFNWKTRLHAVLPSMATFHFCQFGRWQQADVGNCYNWCAQLQLIELDWNN